MKKYLTIAVMFVIGSANADCRFLFVNKSHSPVTLQGFYLDKGDIQEPSAWVTVPPTLEETQVRSGAKCNDIYHHTSQLLIKAVLKNSSAFWVGNNGFLFASDKMYSHYLGNSGIADDGQKITLSNAIKVNSKEVKLTICDASVNRDDCK